MTNYKKSPRTSAKGAAKLIICVAAEWLAAPEGNEAEGDDADGDDAEGDDADGDEPDGVDPADGEEAVGVLPPLFVCFVGAFVMVAGVILGATVVGIGVSVG
jgi:hypothetical protein